VAGRSWATQAVKLSNGTGGSETGSHVAVSGEYSQTNNCGVVATGASCTVNVKFSPANAGASNGTLTVTTNSGVKNVTLSGTGLNFTLSSARPSRPLRGSSGSEIVLDPGQTQIVELQVGVLGGSGEVIFACQSASQQVSCTVEPARLYVGADVQVVKVRISAPGRASRLAKSSAELLRVTATMLGETRTSEIAVKVQGKAEQSVPRRQPLRLGR
jgi:hypothetical protein